MASQSTRKSVFWAINQAGFVPFGPFLFQRDLLQHIRDNVAAPVREVFLKDVQYIDGVAYVSSLFDGMVFKTNLPVIALRLPGKQMLNPGVGLIGYVILPGYRGSLSTHRDMNFIKDMYLDFSLGTGLAPSAFLQRYNAASNGARKKMRASLDSNPEWLRGAIISETIGYKSKDERIVTVEIKCVWINSLYGLPLPANVLGVKEFREHVQLGSVIRLDFTSFERDGEMLMEVGFGDYTTYPWLSYDDVWFSEIASRLFPNHEEVEDIDPLIKVLASGVADLEATNTEERELELNGNMVTYYQNFALARQWQFCLKAGMYPQLQRCSCPESKHRDCLVVARSMNH